MSYKHLAIQVGAFALAGILVYLALRGAELPEIVEALRAANYGWLIPLLIVTILGHVLRAWRWKILLEALPRHASNIDRTQVPLKTTFYATMIGYMINYAVPRLGEVVRSADVAAHEELSFAAVFGTVVVERILDALVLVLGLMISFYLLFDQLGVIQKYFIDPILIGLNQGSLSLMVGVIFGITFSIAFIYWTACRPQDARLRRYWNDRLRPIWRAFRDGLATVLRSPRRLALVFSTIAMWFTYFLLTYLPLLMFDVAGTYDVSPPDAMTLLFLGAIGIAIPTPGGVGSFHYITRQALVYLFIVDESVAVTYAFFVHGWQMIVCIIVGCLCLIMQRSSLSLAFSRARNAREEPGTGASKPGA